MTPPAPLRPVAPLPLVELVETSPRLKVLIVCTGNICRSPLAERLLETRLAEHGVPAAVTSAGTRAMSGQPMTTEAAALSIRYGAAQHTHSAQQLTANLIMAADLVLTATREHRSEVVSLYPRAARYSYTLNQFARLVAATPPVELADTTATSKLRAYIAEIAATKGLTPPPQNSEDDDIEDPYRQSDEVYSRVAQAIDQATTTITTALAAVETRA